MSGRPRPPRPWRGWVTIAVGRILFGVAYRVQVLGRDRVPRQGPVLFVANHVGFLDGPLLPAVAPRPTFVLVKQEMFVGPLGWLLRFLGHIPVARKTADRQALGTAVAILHAGGAVGIFPEGTRGRGDVASVEQGAAWLAEQGRARVVPVAFLGTRATGATTGSLPRPRSRMVVEFGAPIELDHAPGLSGRARLVEATEQVRIGLSAHVMECERRHGVSLPQDAG